MMKGMQHEEWIKSGWRAFPARQQPVWRDAAVRDEILGLLPGRRHLEPGAGLHPGGGAPPWKQIQAWHRQSLDLLPASQKYEELARQIRKTISFMTAIGFDTATPQLKQATLYTSHEPLLLDYEEALIRQGRAPGRLEL